MAKDLRLKPCRYCRRNFDIEHMTRSDAECWFHHTYTLCNVHGCINCPGTEHGCAGSRRVRTYRSDALGTVTIPDRED